MICVILSICTLCYIYMYILYKVSLQYTNKNDSCANGDVHSWQFSFMSGCTLYSNDCEIFVLTIKHILLSHSQCNIPLWVWEIPGENLENRARFQMRLISIAICIVSLLVYYMGPRFRLCFVLTWILTHSLSVTRLYFPLLEYQAGLTW